MGAAPGRGRCHDVPVRPSLIRATLLLGGLAAWASATTALGASPTRAGETQEVRLHLALSSRPHGTEAERDRIRELEEAFLGLLAERSAGEVSADAWEGGVCVITIATQDARLAWSAVEAAVRQYGPLPGSFAVIRPGPKGAAEEKVPLALRRAEGEREPATPPR
jgi:hypothetical protein